MDPELATTIVSVAFGFILIMIMLFNFMNIVIKVYKLKGIRVYSRKSEKSIATKDGEILEVTFPLGLEGDEEKFEYCQKQIKLWQGALLQIGRESDTSDGNNNTRHSKNSDKESSSALESNSNIAGSIQGTVHIEGGRGENYEMVAKEEA